MSRDDATGRLDWVDVAKGICIVLVVMMHSTFGVERTIGTSTSLHGFIDWARPFRMPDFFLISGLFLAARIDRPWRAYLDTKVVHFAYFYVLWLNIQFAMKAPAMVRELGLNGAASAYLLSYVQPFGTLWFIYLLALFFVATKLLRDVPKPVVLIGAAILHVLAPHTVSLVVDEFADRFVFFYAGYAAAPLLLALADRIAHQPAPLLLAGLTVWAWVNWLGVESELALAAWSDLPFAFAGILAVITSSVLLARSGRGRALAYCGRHSIVIYLAFPLFIGPTRVLLLKVLPMWLADMAALVTTAAGVIGALLLFRLVRDTPMGFLFVRPKIVASITSQPRAM
ncbi:MAG: acyltransferase [Alphaproteobacteria bacterium]|nr:MAG: acyltransferase [Alphaproteobacteria bacterium]